MKKISNYIFEKLHLNKDIILNPYNEGDKCLLLSLYNWDSKSFMKNTDKKNFIGLDVCEIISVDKKEIQYQFITDNHHITNKIITMTKKDKSKFFYSIIQDINIELILTKDESIDIIDYIKKNKKFDFINKLGFTPNGWEDFEGKEIQISFNKEHKEIIFDENKIDKIEKLLK